MRDGAAVSYGKQLSVPRKVKHKIDYGPAISFLGMYPEELKTDVQKYLYTNIHSSTVCSN